MTVTQINIFQWILKIWYIKIVFDIQVNIRLRWFWWGAITDKLLAEMKLNMSQFDGTIRIGIYSHCKIAVHVSTNFSYIELFYLNSTVNFGIPTVLVFQLEVYYKVDRLLTGLTAQQKGTTARWYSNKTSLVLGNEVEC